MAKLGIFWVFTVGKVALSRRENERNFWMKIASPSGESSSESAENRAFDRDLTDVASYFRFKMRLELLNDPWNPWNISILAEPKMTTVTQKIVGFSKMRFYYQKHQWSSQSTMYYIGRLDGLPKTGVSGRQDLKITVFGRFQHFLV